MPGSVRPAGTAVLTPAEVLVKPSVYRARVQPSALRRRRPVTASGHRATSSPASTPWRTVPPTFWKVLRPKLLRATAISSRVRTSYRLRLNVPPRDQRHWLPSSTWWPRAACSVVFSPVSSPATER